MASGVGAAAAKKRWAWSGLSEWFWYRGGRLYDSFYYGQYTTKYALALLFPAVIWSTRFRTDTKLFYRVYIADEELFPDKSANVFFDSKWTNGRKFFLSDDSTVADLKKAVYYNNNNNDDDKRRRRGPAGTAAAGGGSNSDNNNINNSNNINNNVTTAVSEKREDASSSSSRGTAAVSSSFLSSLRVGCHGRMMDDDDNLAIAVKAFCRRDPKLVIWRDDDNDNQ